MRTGIRTEPADPRDHGRRRPGGRHPPEDPLPPGTDPLGRLGRRGRIAVFVLITGLLVVGVTYGGIVRWALQPSTGSGGVAAAALGAGAASLAGYALLFAWAPVLVAPAAFLLTREALSRRPGTTARRMAWTGAGFAGLAVAVWTWFVIALVRTGDFPIS